MPDRTSRSSTPLGDWNGLETEIKRIVSESCDAFDPATVANARELVALMRERCPVPEVVKGYWSTFQFYWVEAKVDFEVFNDRIEVYRSFDLRTDIRHYAHKPGEPFAPEVIGALPKLPG